MNEVLRSIAGTASAGWVPGVVTGIFLVVFATWTVWVFLPSNRQHLDEAARLPLDDDTTGPQERSYNGGQA